MGEQVVAEGPAGEPDVKRERSCSPGQAGTESRAPPARRRQQPRKRHRRRPPKKKRRWKPYFKLSWEEKKKLDERESVRAAKTRAEMFAKGFTVAPYNTTQFLMEEHNQEEPDLNTGGGPGGGGGGPGVCPQADPLSEEEQQDSGSDGMGGGGEFLRRDFSETYERYHAESLQNMTKQELIREYLELEKCLSRLEDENNRLRGRPDRGADPAASESRAQEMESEVERLKTENHRLELENELYRRDGRCLENGI
ncbi:protein HEXIM1-like [Scyliorhinus canicula]|uniref:protein HEXIM1-like n=1 Tax=Scyliorhinus canicula TaxID=7830 RepID=UPI0018F7CBCB|nr:protein HEXIM1-like [Scyliorhinus canicula]